MIELEAGLWSTNDPTYKERLARAVSRTGRRSRSRAYGSLALARWDFHEGRPEVALQRLDGVHPFDQELQADLDLFRADCFFAEGDSQAALTVLSRMTGRFTTDQNLLLRVGQARSLMGRTVDHGSGPVTEALNGIYNTAGLGMIRRTSVRDPIGINNLSCDVREAEPVGALPLVTVVVVLPESVPEGHSGLACLLDQSWRNLEVLVAAGAAAGERLAASDRTLLEDPRVRIVEEDGDATVSSYVRHATGELVTTHRYGSWAHPQRIEMQATALLVDPSLSGTISHHMNVSSGLDPRPLAATPRVNLVGPDPWSTMIRLSPKAPEDSGLAYDRVTALHSTITGDMETPEDVADVHETVPLTLTLADAWPVIVPSRAVES